MFKFLFFYIFSLFKDILLWSAAFTACLIQPSVCVIFLKYFLNRFSGSQEKFGGSIQTYSHLLELVLCCHLAIRHYCSRWFDFYWSYNDNILTIVIFLEFLILFSLYYYYSDTVLCQHLHWKHSQDFKIMS